MTYSCPAYSNTIYSHKREFMFARTHTRQRQRWAGINFISEDNWQSVGSFHRVSSAQSCWTIADSQQLVWPLFFFLSCNWNGRRFASIQYVYRRVPAHSMGRHYTYITEWAALSLLCPLVSGQANGNAINEKNVWCCFFAGAVTGSIGNEFLRY